MQPIQHLRRRTSSGSFEDVKPAYYYGQPTYAAQGYIAPTYAQPVTYAAPATYAAPMTYAAAPVNAAPSAYTTTPI